MVAISTFDNLHELTAPRRIQQYIMVYCTGGQLTLTIDGTLFTLHSGDVVTITSGQIHQFRESAHATGYLLTFTLDYFVKDDHDIELIFHNGLFCHFGMNEVIPVDRKVVEEQLECISSELKEQPYQYLISVHSRIKLILVAINRAKVRRGDEIWKPDALFLRFLEAIRDHSTYHYPVAKYAEILATTELKLNELSKLHTGKTAQNVIYSLMTSAAKRSLIYENLSIKEVAYQLGFNDPFYFSNFFKKQTNLSPSQFREQYEI
ncbi:AraC family transcriptional regulator [Chitinophaga sp. Cy-1792]|uniref:AraC family transcriptional regulator n=1 Tax=Chitinophaga sp. Cy-1792 TaxID=2608339 RepID=UPI0014221D1B|nr:helix-turn-helix domain-containing protein [Chitinophaga sp. Cy-1792]NIG56622.1 helix-turn-helix domain-containing protein [Chitinophaga sp. Cy-1792]